MESKIEIAGMQNRQGNRGPKMTLSLIKQSIKQEPFYECEDGVLYCADCMDILPQLPDGCVDLVLSDPPYNVGIEYATVQDSRTDYDSWCRAWFDLLLQKSKATMFTCGIANLGYWLNLSPRWVISWVKNNSMRRITIGFNCWEPVVLWGQPKLNLYRDVIEAPTIPQNNGHPTPKPEALFEKLVYGFSESTAIILDPFLGSGTTAVACKRLGRKFIGIEISEEYCRIAKDRIMATEKGITVKELKRGQKVLF